MRLFLFSLLGNDKDIPYYRGQDLMQLSSKHILLFLFWIVSSITGLTQDYQPKEENGKWGFVNSKNEWVIKPKYIAVNKFSEGLAAVQKGIKWGFINTNGDYVVKPVYGYVNDFNEGKAAVLSFKPLEGTTKEDKLKHKWGFINKLGEMIIPFSFRNTFPFENDIALVANWGQQDKELYMINPQGKAVSPPFVAKETYTENLLKIKNIRINGDSTYKYISKTGESKTQWYINNFEYKDFPVKVYLPSDLRNDTIPTNAFKGDSKERLCAMMDKRGGVFTIWFNKINVFSKGYAPAQFNRSWGIIDTNYKWIVTPRYNDIELIEEGFYQATIDLNRSVLLDEQGNVLSEEVGAIESFNDQFFLMSYSNKFGGKIITSRALFDKKGKQRTGWYQNINSFYNGFTRIEEQKTTRFSNDSIGTYNWYNYAVDSTGDVMCFWRAENKIEWDKSFRIFKDSILNFLYAPDIDYHLTKEYFNKVFIKDFIIDVKKGNILFQGGNYNDGMALVSRKIGVIKKTIHGLEFTMDDIRYGYINWLGKLVIPYKYKEASSFSDGKAIIADNNKYGAIDFTGRIIIKPQHQLMGNFGNNLAPVFKDSTWGYINASNRLIIPYEYDEARPFKFGYASVKKGKEWGVVDLSGKVVLAFNYRKAPIPKSTNQIEVLEKGVGYVIVDL